MAQVTMTSQEYLELVDKARRLEQLEQLMLENVEVEVDPESSYRKYRISITPTFTPVIEKQVVRKIVDGLVTSDAVMDELYVEREHFLKVQDGYIRSHWGDECEPGEVDLLKDKAFKKAWDKALARMEEPKEESNDVSEE